MFRRPVEKGYLVNWEAEKEIWDLTFLDKESPLAVSCGNKAGCHFGGADG